MATSASHAIRSARARTRAAGPSSTRERAAESAVTAAKKPTTAQPHASYEGGKVVPATAATATITSAARSRTSQRPGRLNTSPLQLGERPGRELARRLVRVVE